MSRKAVKARNYSRSFLLIPADTTQRWNPSSDPKKRSFAEKFHSDRRYIELGIRRRNSRPHRRRTLQHLDAPVKRVAARDTFVAYQPQVEDEILPQANDTFKAMVELAEY